MNTQKFTNRLYVIMKVVGRKSRVYLYRTGESFEKNDLKSWFKKSDFKMCWKNVYYDHRKSFNITQKKRSALIFGHTSSVFSLLL